MALLFDTNTDEITADSVSGLTVPWNSTTFSFACWFKKADTGAGATNDFIFKAQGISFDRECALYVDGTDGTLRASCRSPAANFFTDTGQAVDDDTWYPVLYVRNALADFEIWLDGTEILGETTSIALQADGISDFHIGNQPDLDQSWGKESDGLLARCAYWGEALSWEEAYGFLLSGQISTVPEFWVECDAFANPPNLVGSPSFSSNGLSAADVSTDGPPMMSPWGFDLQVPYEVAAVGGSSIAAIQAAHARRRG